MYSLTSCFHCRRAERGSKSSSRDQPLASRQNLTLFW
jgi:hypothetical protein